MKMIALAMDSSCAGPINIPRLTMKVVTPAGGCGVFAQVSTKVIRATDNAAARRCAVVRPSAGADIRKQARCEKSQPDGAAGCEDDQGQQRGIQAAALTAPRFFRSGVKRLLSRRFPLDPAGPWQCDLTSGGTSSLRINSYWRVRPGQNR